MSDFGYYMDPNPPGWNDDDPIEEEDDEAAHHHLQLERELRTLEMFMSLKANGIELDTIEYLAGELGLHSAWKRYEAAHHPNLTKKR